MSTEPRLTASSLRVLAALMASPRAEMSGTEIGREAKVASGTLYPILMRFEEAGWLISRWEDGDPRELGRPRRRFYSVTAVGAAKARSAFRELEPAFRRMEKPAWA
jgi:PadR family transcriptional regulator PadR